MMKENTSSMKGSIGFRLAAVALTGAWLFILVEWIGHESQRSIVFNRYSEVFFAALLLLILLIVPLGRYLLRPNTLANDLEKALALLQRNPWVAAGVLVGLAYAAGFLTKTPRLENFPGTRLVLVAGALGAIPVLILSRWKLETTPPLWRRIGLGAVVLLLGAELLVQGLSVFRMLPAGFSTIDGLFEPYGRMYIAGVGNRVVNRNGWYTEPFDLDAAQRRVVLLGDEILFAPGLPTEQHIDALLERLLNGANQEGPVKVLAFGAPGFGPAHYYEGVENTITFYQPDEIIVLFNLGNDFANLRPSLDGRSPQENIYYIQKDDGSWNLHPGSLDPQHVMTHRYTDPTRPLYVTSVHAAASHLLLGRVASHILGGDNGPGQVASNAEFCPEPTPETEKALTLAVELLKISRQVAQANAVDFKIVTIPAAVDLQAAFQAGQTACEPLLSEQLLRAALESDRQSVFSLGEYLLSSAGSGSTVETFYTSEGNALWTAAGHEIAAEGLFSYIQVP